MIIHIVSVPVFVLGTLSLFVSLIELSPIGMLISILVVVIAFGAQGFGHSKERISPESFATPGQAIFGYCRNSLLRFRDMYYLAAGTPHISLRLRNVDKGFK